jgi:hypothetical protein
LSFAQNSTTPPRTGVAEDYTFSVPADQSWVDTNIDLYPGDHVYILGAVIECAGLNHSSKLDVPIPSAPIGALLAKLQLEAHPVLATPDARLAIIDPSHIYLGVNGWRCPGKIPAKVHVERRATASRKP